ncbi:MAG: hypothetical protein ACU4F9_07295 [Arcticibacter sp.]
MLKTFITCIMVAITANSLAAPSDSTGLPGDHFSLEAALAMFKASANPSDFEKRINDSKNGVNNLDLNGDGRVDFLKIKTVGEGDDRMVVISSVLSKDESQDVAVIEISRQGKEHALLQIVGDEDLYGNSRVVEPYEEGQEDDIDRGPSANINGSVEDIWVNVWFWPCVTWFYGPGYIVYVSPWYWDFYPDWWMPWPPYTYVIFYGYCEPYHHHYHHVHVHRTARMHQTVYMPRRESSRQVVRKFERPVREYRDKNPAPPRQPEKPMPKPSHTRPEIDRDQQRDEDRKPTNPAPRGGRKPR